MNKFLDQPIEKKPFASRAGAKLAHAFDVFDLSVNGMTCADLGASNGGFTDCLLQKGAKKVYAVDTAKGTLDWKLREDERVVVMEGTNALHLELPEGVDFVSIDVSWTRQVNILPASARMLRDNGKLITLVKPHYEADKTLLRKGTLPEEHVEEVMSNVISKIEQLGLTVLGKSESPITGKKGGNIEYLIWLKK